jgi:hypothetical protein
MSRQIFLELFPKLDSFYLDRYLNFIEKFKDKYLGEYNEEHHIIPKSFRENKIIIKLSARAHFVAHLLLAQLFKNSEYKKEYQKMIYAVKCMTSKNVMPKAKNRELKVNAKTYQMLKSQFNESIRGSNNPFYGKHHTKEVLGRILKSNLGKKQSKETIEKRIKKTKGKKRSDEQKERYRISKLGSKNSMFGKNAFESKTEEEMKEIKKHISESNKKTWVKRKLLNKECKL